MLVVMPLVPKPAPGIPYGFNPPSPRGVYRRLGFGKKNGN